MRRVPAGAPVLSGLAHLGGGVLDALAEVGQMFLFTAGSVLHLPTVVRHGRLFLEQMYVIGVGSFPVALATAIFTGGVAAVQAAYQFANFVPMIFLGSVIAKSVVIELGPVLTAVVVGGRVAASIAAEIGTMRVTEQIDAMESLGIHPVQYLVVPRIMAAIIMLPVITVLADLMGILGGWVVAILSIGVSSHTFEQGLRLNFEIRDIYGGLVKSFAFGFIIAAMGCFYGFRTTGGAEGVGQATMKAVVASLVLILINDYVLAEFIFRILFGVS
jgi:phospholipid/cholesterol/gamma-HCH transport system permease protein